MTTTNRDDDLTIPDFCRIPQDVRNRAWERNPPKPFKLLNSAVDEAEAAAIAARHEAIRKEKSARKIEKLKKHLAKKNDRGAKPKDYDPERHRWNPAKGRFEVDPLVLLREQWAEQERRANSPLVELRNTAGAVTGRMTSSKPNFTEKAKVVRKVRVDSPMTKGSELATSVAIYDTRDKLTAFAKANGCWNDKYDKLPNPGLIRMNVLNRLRAKVKKGHQVKWLDK